MRAPLVTTTISLALEKAINTAVKYDPASRTKLNALGEQRICIESQNPDLSFTFIIQEQGVLVHANIEGASEDNTSDVRLTGEAKDFISLIGQGAHSLSQANISVTGKIAILQQLQNVLNDLDIDWEEPLTEMLGVVPGHSVATSIRTTLGWLHDRHNEFERNLPDLLIEELRLLPAASELNVFYEEVDSVSAAAQRLEARIQRLHTQRTKSV